MEQHIDLQADLSEDEITDFDEATIVANLEAEADAEPPVDRRPTEELEAELETEETEISREFQEKQDAETRTRILSTDQPSEVKALEMDHYDIAPSPYEVARRTNARQQQAQAQAQTQERAQAQARYEAQQQERARQQQQFFQEAVQYHPEQFRQAAELLERAAYRARDVECDPEKGGELWDRARQVRELGGHVATYHQNAATEKAVQQSAMRVLKDNPDLQNPNSRRGKLMFKIFEANPELAKISDGPERALRMIQLFDNNRSK